MAPSAVRLADCSVRGALESHALLTPEGDDGVQGGASALQPPIGEDAGRTAIYFCAERKGKKIRVKFLHFPFIFLFTFAVRLLSRPLLVPLAPPDGVADEHVAVVALVRDERVVTDGGVDGATVQRVVRHVALDSFIRHRKGRGDTCGCL